MAGSFDDMVDSLEASRRSATDTAAGVRTFVSDASHELRTPVSALHASAETLLRTDPPRHRRERLAVQMVREATRAAKLVDDLLAMARLRHGPATPSGAGWVSPSPVASPTPTAARCVSLTRRGVHA